MRVSIEVSEWQIKGAKFTCWACLLIAIMVFFATSREQVKELMNFRQEVGIIQGEAISGGIEEIPLRYGSYEYFVNTYNFATPDGKKFEGVSYSEVVKLTPGDKVKIEYVKEDPSISRIQYMRTTIRSLDYGIKATLVWVVGFVFFFLLGYFLRTKNIENAS